MWTNSSLFATQFGNHFYNSYYIQQVLTNLFLMYVNRHSCETVFSKYSSLDRLVLFVNHRMLRLLEILRKFNPGDDSSYNAVKISGIIFVERRCMANILCHFLQVSTHLYYVFPYLFFIIIFFFKRKFQNVILY